MICEAEAWYDMIWYTMQKHDRIWYDIWYVKQKHHIVYFNWQQASWFPLFSLVATFVIKDPITKIESLCKQLENVSTELPLLTR